MQHRRSWMATLDGVGREWQTVFGGALLSCDLDGHRVDARVTQPFGRQQYAFALSIDGELQPGSDAQPEPGKLKRQTLIAFSLLMAAIFVITFVMVLLDRLG